jgi:hypothetical protein
MDGRLPATSGLQYDTIPGGAPTRTKKPQHSAVAIPSLVPHKQLLLLESTELASRCTKAGNKYNGEPSEKILSTDGEPTGAPPGNPLVGHTVAMDLLPLPPFQRSHGEHGIYD